jgi:ethanolamine utilization protein EutA
MDRTTVHLIGLDFGSTTSGALVARARVAHHSVTGRMQLESPEVVYRPEPVFTPFRDDGIDAAAVDALLDRWFSASGVRPQDFFAGGAIITGLAALRDNAALIARAVGRRIGEAVVATADDPCLESWLAFMGSCSTLSRLYPDRLVLNLDIGGGTTNPALGRGGDVLATGCHYIGARHFQVRPGTYRLTSISQHGRALLQALGLHRDVGDVLDEPVLAAILDWYVAALEAVVHGDRTFFAAPVGRMHEQAAFPGSTDAAITFSGGVGELLYRHAAGQPLPGTTHFGDLGIDLAVRISRSPLLARDLGALVPEQRGRATVYGLALHSTEVSGTTLFLPDADVLPLRDLPVVARLRIDTGSTDIDDAIALAQRHAQGACIQFLGTMPAQDGVKRLGERIARALDNTSPLGRPLVLLLESNLGKTLGNYATDWGRARTGLIVVDEMPDRHAHFANIGRPRDGVVPVSFYGMH